ncbi:MULTISPECIES: hypothetical protein [Streptomyces]|uniref:Uncharacterized protein n=1 Tax=Streptomyces doebereineriae TaxID=3075528 RepID=A0ABU2VEF2_9ACTN|nr:hypothetical protein [Streptomyces sp. DSM 41640]MDT0483948.1 hypothetical protein [Streptomyces sp. DSM 41640]
MNTGLQGLPVRWEIHARELFADGHRFTGRGTHEVVTATAPS